MMELPKGLICPRCKSPFDWDMAIEEEVETMGIIQCTCTTYPVVAGIPVLQNNALTELVKEFLHCGDHDKAISILLDTQRRTLPGESLVRSMAKKFTSMPVPLQWYLRQDASVGTVGLASNRCPDTFVESIESRDLGHFGDYLVYRPFEQSFWNLHAFIPTIRSCSGPILDFGGGWGHSSHLVHMTAEEQVCNVEINFEPLYHQRKYFTEELNAVVVESGNDIPFEPDTFGTVLDLDGFHYIQNKYGMASEYERVARPDGQLMLLHTHNREVTQKGYPLTPEQYADCFSWDVMLIPEEDFLSAFLGSECGFTIQDWAVSGNQEISLIARRADISDREIQFADHPFDDYNGPLVVNPIYKATIDGSHVELVRVDVSDQFDSEFAFSMELTEKHYEFNLNKPPPTDLLHRGVLTPMPRTYADVPILSFSD